MWGAIGKTDYSTGESAGSFLSWRKVGLLGWRRATYLPTPYPKVRSVIYLVELD
jgi:hypothetical protein